MSFTRKRHSGGTCGCMKVIRGGYKATRKNKELLSRLRKGSPIGFTAIASLKAKGLLARTSKAFRGKKVIGPKYK